MKIIKFISLVGFIQLAVSCDGTDFSSSKKTTSASGTTSVAVPENDVNVDVDGDGYFIDFDIGDEEIVGNGVSSQRVWINFEGGVVQSSDSGVVAGLNLNSVNVPPFEATDLGDEFIGQSRPDIIESIMSKLGERFAGINIILTNKEPAPPYTTIYIGGNNVTDKSSLLGIAPMDVGNFSSADIGFVYTKEFPAYQYADALEVLVNTIAHELGHAVGTRHIINEIAMMNPVLNVENNDFNHIGRYPDAEGEENSKEVLEVNLGVGEAQVYVTTPPDLPALTALKSDGIVQLSLINRENIDDNPEHDLRAFNYTWFYNGNAVEGTAVRLKLDEVDTNEITVTVPGLEGDSNKVKEFRFVIE